ncbi:MAG: hypothetical protein HYY45_03555 [Deltaproteobacteria bacterium]|nr:hypothetical protein [Deltaproteobacteria bacterium]
MEPAKKITIQVPENLLRRAQKATGLGITPTVRQGLELLAASESYEKLRRLRGKVKFSIDLQALREDRE